MMRHYGTPLWSHFVHDKTIINMRTNESVVVGSTAAIVLLLLAEFCTPFSRTAFHHHHQHLPTCRVIHHTGGTSLGAATKKSSAPIPATTKSNRKSGNGFGLSTSNKSNKRSNVVESSSSSSSGSGAKASTPTTKQKSNVKQNTASAIATQQDNYIIFPPLEPNVQATLIPGNNMATASTLPFEIYDRLDQIYGFSNFNYETATAATTTATESTSQHNDSIPALLVATDNNIIRNNDEEERDDQELVDSLAKIPAFQNFRVLHVDPMVLVIDNFLTMEECDRYIGLGSSNNNNNDSSFVTRSKTVGNDSVSKAQRTSTTWFHHYSVMPELLAKATRLLGLDSIRQWEEPQTVRYRKSEHFTWHLDALAPSPALQSLGGQRIATLLVYLTEMSKEEHGGCTIFRDLGPLKIHPKKGSALLFFPAAGGIPNAPFDIRTVHAGEAIAESAHVDKWIAQLWLREGRYTPTAPVGNVHCVDSIHQFCSKQEQ